MATRMMKVRTVEEELALREKRLRSVLGDAKMQQLNEITTKWNLRHATDPSGNIGPLTMVSILIYLEHEKRFPEKHGKTAATASDVCAQT